jgi:LytS/YehU family sensor histidine kinase
LICLKITGKEIIQLDKLTQSIQKYLEHHRRKFEDREKITYAVRDFL